MHINYTPYVELLLITKLNYHYAYVPTTAKYPSPQMW